MGLGIAQKLGITKQIDLFKLQVRYLKFLLIRKKDHSQKVFVIGFNKTGTTSINDALIEWNYNIADQKLMEYATKKVYENDYSRLFKLCEYSNAFQDMPFSIPNIYKHLHAKYPNAKFILSLRDNPDVWLKSVKRFYSKISKSKHEIPTESDLKNCGYRYKGFIHDYFLNTFGNLNFDDSYIQKYEEHRQDVINFFKSIGKDKQLIEIKIEDPNSYKDLALFLGKPILQDSFKLLNTSKN